MDAIEKDEQMAAKRGWLSGFGSDDVEGWIAFCEGVGGAG